MSNTNTKGAVVVTGKVKFFNVLKGFGFITTDEGTEIFFHKNNIKNTGFRDRLYEGDRVDFEVQRDQKGSKAVNIKRI